ncbi:hypothetical protein M5K25_025610 [Dendrobium thyrsiflorum]|uniref:Uncharacterized protein n=1 Tax=Dendrobium thyrsiflorum TaxID=117978 RepID=A0ABD0U4J9_DENTH
MGDYLKIERSAGRDCEPRMALIPCKTKIDFSKSDFCKTCYFAYLGLGFALVFQLTSKIYCSSRYADGISAGAEALIDDNFSNMSCKFLIIYNLRGPRFLSLTNGMNKGSRSKCLDAAVAEASGGAAITKELERMINNIMVKSKYGRHIDDLKISAKMIHRHHRPSGIRRARPGRR